MKFSTPHVLAVGIVAVATFAPTKAAALIPIPVGGHPHELDVFMRVTLERGLVEPNENKASFQKANWNMVTLGGGYGIGNFGLLQDLAVRLEATGYQSPEETNDPERGPVDAARCPDRSLAPGLCSFHSADRGAFVSPSVSTSLFHTATVSFGVFVVGNVPIGVNYRKFVVPRVDFIGGGFRGGAELAPAFALESSFYMGSGSSGAAGRQNGTFAATQLLHFRSPVLGARPFFRLGVKLGPYVDGDLVGERTDPRYDRAYTAGYPDRTDRIRMFRFAATVLPYIQMSNTVSLELSYLQKIFGYDTPATQLYGATLRYVF